MALTRTTSRKNINDSVEISDSKNVENEDESSNKNLSTTESTSTASSTTINLNSERNDKTPSKNVPKMKSLNITEASSGASSSASNKSSISPRAIPRSPQLLKSPRTLKAENSTTSQQTSPREDFAKRKSEKKSSSPEKVKTDVQNLPSSASTASADHIASPNTQPVIQIRRSSVAIPSRLLKEKSEESTISTSTSPRGAKSSSSTTSQIMPIAIAADTPPSVHDSSAALLQLILKEYEKKPPTSQTIKVLGRDDIYFPVVRLPKTLTHLCDFPDKGISSISELLETLFGKKLMETPAWKKVLDAVDQGLSLDDGLVEFGEMDIQVKRKYVELLKPLAANIADAIFGEKKIIEASSLPIEFINLLYEGDKKLLEICIDSKNLRIREINDARLHFMFNLTVTRFLQVLIVKNFSERPTQVESWFMSGIFNALGDGIIATSGDFLTQTSKKIPEYLIQKFNAKASAEIIKDEAIKKLKQMQLTQSRINELKVNDSRRNNVQTSGHTRSSSNVDLGSLKFERDNKKKLNDLKTSCGFDDMGKEFLIFIEKNQRTWFRSNQKFSESSVLASLKISVLKYLSNQDRFDDSNYENAQEIIKKCDIQLDKIHEEKKKRRTTTYSKDIKFSVSVSKSTNSKVTTLTATSSTATTSDIVSPQTNYDSMNVENNSASSNETQPIQPIQSE